MDSPKVHGDCEWWTQDRIAQFKRRIVQTESEFSEPVALILLDLIAERAGKEINFLDLCKKANLKKEPAAAGLTNITNLMKSEFALEYEKTYWPVEIKFRPTRYCMPIEIAHRWKNA